jgi:hypothetical protein
VARENPKPANVRRPVPVPTPTAGESRYVASLRRAFRALRKSTEAMAQKLRLLQTMTTADTILDILREGNGVVTMVQCKRHRIACVVVIRQDGSQVLSCQTCITEVINDVMGRQVR